LPVNVRDKQYASEKSEQFDILRFENEFIPNERERFFGYIKHCGNGDYDNDAKNDIQFSVKFVQNIFLF